MGQDLFILVFLGPKISGCNREVAALKRQFNGFESLKN